MAKLPYMKFYPSDFIVDTQTLSVEEIGCWMKMLCYIWIHSTNGTVQLSNQEIAHLWGLDVVAAMRIFSRMWDKGIFENRRGTLSGDVASEDQNDVVNNITSRRISRDKKELRMNALYVSKARSKGFCKEKVRDKKSEVRSQKSEETTTKSIGDAPPALAFGADVERRSTDRPKAKYDLYGQEGFEEFWAAYPNRLGKLDAARAWKRLAPDNDLQWKMLTAVEQHAQSDQWIKDDGRFIPRASTWLNGRRWEDELESSNTSGGLPSWQNRALDQIQKKSSQT